MTKAPTLPRLTLYGTFADRYRLVEAAGDWLNSTQSMQIESCVPSVECIIIDNIAGEVEVRFKHGARK